MSRVFVGGLAWATTEDSLRSRFEEFGEIASCTVISDRETGRSRGFGFVEFASSADADAAVKGMTDQELDGRTIRCDIAAERGSGGGGARRGGFGGDRGGDRGSSGGYRGGDRDRGYERERSDRSDSYRGGDRDGYSRGGDRGGRSAPYSRDAPRDGGYAPRREGGSRDY